MTKISLPYEINEIDHTYKKKKDFNFILFS